MTSLETMDMVRLLLDDSRDWFPTTAFIVQTINDAQLQKINEYYKQGDERALRPLYRQAYDAAGSVFLFDGNLIYDVNGNLDSVLYPRSCKIMSSVNASSTNPPYSTMVTANYLENAVYYNYVRNTINLPNPILVTGFNNVLQGSNFPRSGYYTIHTVWNRTNNRQEDRINFTASDPVNNVATFWYIAEPTPFAYVDNNPASSVQLSVPAEYHVEIASLAAEIINRTDVNELERAESAAPNVKQTFTDITE